MDKDYHNPSLYKWKRQTKPRIVPSSQRVRNDNDIENWLKKVEEASNQAVELTFNGDKKISGRNRGKQSAYLAKEEVLYHDEASTEAEELLNQWMNDKILISDEIDDEYISDIWKQKAIENEVKHAWDDIYNDEEEVYKVSPRKYKRERSPDPYAHLYEADESDTVATILQNMMEKDVVKERFKKDLGFEENRPDPRMKMEMRHKLVKENREKREKDIEQTRRQKQAKKDAHLEAKKIVLKEEKEKEFKSKREEQEIQREMIQIRKQIQDERRRKEEQKMRLEEDKLNKEISSRQHIQQMREDEERKMLRHQKSIEERKQFVMKKMSEIQTKQVSNNMRLLHQHFTAWYEVTLKRRLLMGKCRAMFDWKLLLRTWNGWKSYVRSKKLDKETRQHEKNLLEHHRKNQMATRHHHTSLLQKYFTAWTIWLQQEHDRQQFKQAQNVTRQKMMALLEKAATGQLWNHGEEEGIKTNDNKPNNNTGSQSARHNQNNQILDEMFAQNNDKKLNSTTSHNGPLSSKSETMLSKTKNTPPRIPTQAWQINRKHLNLTNEEIASLGGGDSELNSHVSDKSIRKRFGTQPWMNTHFIVNNFEHRYSAQQKILTDQQSQLKEQKRLIEDLRYQQMHQNLTNQLEHQNQNSGEVTPKQEVDCRDTNSAIETERTDTTVKSSAPRSVCTTSRSDKTDLSTITASTNLTKISQSTKHSQLLKNMEERAGERARLKREREDRRRQMEEERIAHLAAEAEERKRQEEEEKKAKVEAYKEKKRLEKQREQDKQKELERTKEMNKIADDHYLKSIVKYRGLVPMKRLVQLAHDNNQKATDHCNTLILRKVLTSWHEHSKVIMEEKTAMAYQMRDFLLIKHSFKHWSMYKHHMRILEQRADKFRETNLQSKIISVWVDYATEEKMAFWQKERQAKEHYLWYLKKKTLLSWKTLPQKIKLDREKEKRKEGMRQKVQSMLPDYEAVLRKSSNFM